MQFHWALFIEKSNKLNNTSESVQQQKTIFWRKHIKQSISYTVIICCNAFIVVVKLDVGQSFSPTQIATTIIVCSCSHTKGKSYIIWRFYAIYVYSSKSHQWTIADKQEQFRFIYTKTKMVTTRVRYIHVWLDHRKKPYIVILLLQARYTRIVKDMIL